MNKITVKLIELGQLCAKKHIEFKLQKVEVENYVIFNKKSVIINIGDPDDDTLETKIDEKIKELEQFRN